MVQKTAVGLVLALCSFLCLGFDDPYPDTPTISNVDADTDFSKHRLTFSVTFAPAGTVDTCGFDIRLGVSTNDKAGPLLETIREASAITGDQTKSYTSVVNRLFDTSAPDISVTVTDSNNDGNDEVTVSSTGGSWVSDAGTDDVYYVLVYSVSCMDEEAINPVPAASAITDKYYPYYTPFIESSGDHIDIFSFTDSLDTAGLFTGTLQIFTDSNLETDIGIVGYVVHTDSFCTAVPGCDVGTLSTGVDFDPVSSGVWSASLDNFDPVTNNQVFIASVNADGHYGVERSVRIVDLWPSPPPTTDLIATSTPFVAQYTPEKFIWDDNGANSLSLRFGDQMKLGVVMDLSAYTGSPTVSYEWQFSDGSFRRISTAANADTYGDIQVQARNAGTYRVTLHVEDLTIDTPFTTSVFVSEELVVAVDTDPQPPETGVPTDVLFTDVNTAANTISGDLQWSESADSEYTNTDDLRQFDYYLIHLSDQPGCNFSATDDSVNDQLGDCAAGTGRAAGDTRLGVLKYTSGAKTFTLTNIDVGDVSTTPKYVHITAYEMSGGGAESKKTLTYEVVDVIVDSPPSIPIQTDLAFFDMSGTGRVISGKIEWKLDASLDYSTVDQFEVYLHSATTFASTADLGTFVGSFKMPNSFDASTLFSMYLGTFDNELGSEQGDPVQSYPLDVGSTHMDYLIIISRTAPNTDNAALGSIPSTEGAYLFVPDRVDTYYFIEHLAENTGSCPSSFCPGGDPSASVLYWPFAESESVEGSVTIYWLAPHLDSVIYDVDATLNPRLAAVLDNTALDDMSPFFSYSVSLGSSTENELCKMSESATWPFNAPSDWVSVPDLTQRSLFYIASDYKNLKACGFVDTETTQGIAVEGYVTLNLLAAADRTDSHGSLTPTNAPQLTMQARISVTFEDTTHATVASVTVTNVVTVDAIAASVSVGSLVSLYSEAFLVTVDPQLKVFTAGDDKFYVQHSLTSNAEDFYMQLERMWFSPGYLLTDAIEFMVPTSSEAFTNVDQPAVPGRYRLQMEVPYLLNCKPCYMHLVSSLSIASSQKGLPDSSAPKFARSTFQVFVDLPDEASDSASLAQISIVGMGTMFVLGHL
jgi:hypothetical protein